MKKEEPRVKVRSSNKSSVEGENKQAYSKNFVEKLVEAFSSGACYLLEAMRLNKSNNPYREFDIIKNDEEKSTVIKRKDLFK